MLSLFAMFCLALAASTVAQDSQTPRYNEFGSRDDQPDNSLPFGVSGNGDDWSSDNDFPSDSISGRSAAPESSKLVESTPKLDGNEENRSERSSDFGEESQTLISTDVTTSKSPSSTTAGTFPDFTDVSTDSSETTTVMDVTVYTNDTDSEIADDHDDHVTSLPENSPREDNAACSFTLSFVTSLFTFFVSILV
ncbi:serine-rich adhesin for platelets-like [Palaemon carinicauda]|uniref:serine-rich adhesin for platelets-like n=1 Tax=Palaemon carinicauda TaxID=392227 RepID=UPI0035B603B4